LGTYAGTPDSKETTQEAAMPGAGIAAAAARAPGPVSRHHG